MNYSIGQAARAVGVKPHVLRYWEQVIPLLQPEKNQSGHRVYSAADLRLLSRLKYLVFERKFSVEGAYQNLVEKTEAAAGLEDVAIVREELQKILAGAAPAPHAPLPASAPFAKTIPSWLCYPTPRIDDERRRPIRKIWPPATETALKDIPLTLCSILPEEGEGNFPHALLSHLQQIQQIDHFQGQHLVCTHYRMRQHWMDMLLRSSYPVINTQVLPLPFFSDGQIGWQIAPLLSLLYLLHRLPMDATYCYVLPPSGHIDLSLIAAHHYFRPFITLSARSVGTRGLNFSLPMVITRSFLPEAFSAVISCMRWEVKLTRKGDDYRYKRYCVLRQSDLARADADVRVYGV